MSKRTEFEGGLSAEPAFWHQHLVTTGWEEDDSATLRYSSRSWRACLSDLVEARIQAVELWFRVLDEHGYPGDDPGSLSFGCSGVQVAGEEGEVARPISAVIQTSAYHVGGDVQMWVVDENGASALPTEELRQLEADVRGWEQVERDALDKFIPTAPNGAESEAPAEMPPELSADDGYTAG